MEHEDPKRSGVLDFIERVLNEAGGAVIDVYELGSVAVNKTSSALRRAPDLTKKAKEMLTDSIKTKSKVKDRIKEDKKKDLLETHVEGENLHEGEPSEPEPVSAPVRSREPEIPSSKTKTSTGSSQLLKVTVSKERLKRMVKPQLISLCKRLNIECDYTDTKDQIIAKILER